MFLLTQKYSLNNMLRVAQENKDLIQSYIRGSPIECYGSSEDDPLMLGMTIGTFLVILVLAFALWIWALVVTVKYWDVLPDWAKVLSVLGLLGFVGPPLTLVVVYAGKGSSSKRKSRRR